MRATVIRRERLRPLGRLARLLKAPLRTLPYYALAALGHLRPFPLRFRTPWGARMVSYLPEGNTFYYYGYCEANLTNFFLRYVSEGFVCIDIGAHVGYYSMLFSELVGPTGSVHSFEPTPWTYRLLVENTNSLQNVRANNLAISDSETTLSFADYGPGYGAYNTAHADGAAGLHKHATMTEVHTVTLDDYCSGFKRMPDIIKIDAEGFEYHVLSGMQRLTSKSGVARPIISLEVAGGATWGENRKQSLSFLAERDYILFEIAPDGSLSRHTAQSSYQYDNLLCIPEERISELTPFIS